MTNTKLLLGILAATSLVFTACATSQKDSETVSKQVAQEVQDEVEIGRGMAAKLLGHFGHYKDDAELVRYVNLIGQNLARESGRPDLKFRFAVLKTKKINALAAPGGFIFISRGLLRNMRSESELATVLAHEIGHINEKHMYKDIAPKRKTSVGETMTSFLSRGQSGLGMSMSKIIAKGLKTLLEKGLDHKKEYEADKSGILYAAAAGYDTNDYLNLLARVKAKSGPDVFKKTHPSYSERIKRLKAFIKENGLSGGMKANKKVLTKRFRRAMKRTIPRKSRKS